MSFVDLPPNVNFISLFLKWQINKLCLCKLNISIINISIRCRLFNDNDYVLHLLQIHIHSTDEIDIMSKPKPYLLKSCGFCPTLIYCLLLADYFIVSYDSNNAPGVCLYLTPYKYTLIVNTNLYNRYR